MACIPEFSDHINWLTSILHSLGGGIDLIHSLVHLKSTGCHFQDLHWNFSLLKRNVKSLPYFLPLLLYYHLPHNAIAVLIDYETKKNWILDILQLTWQQHCWGESENHFILSSPHIFFDPAL